MASPALKMAVVCMLVLSAGQLMLASAGRDVADAALLRLQELEEEVLAEELALLDDGVGKTVCSSNCQKCLVTCAAPCVVRPPTFVTCFLKCAISKDCFSKK